MTTKTNDISKNSVLTQLYKQLVFECVHW